MKPVDQTEFGKPKGNCFAACVASILEVPLAEVPHCVADDDFPRRLKLWLKERGLGYMSFGYTEGFEPDGYYILSGMGARDLLHAVVGKAAEIVHDPHPSRAGLLDRQYVEVFYPLDFGEWRRRDA